MVDGPDKSATGFSRILYLAANGLVMAAREP